MIKVFGFFFITLFGVAGCAAQEHLDLKLGKPITGFAVDNFENVYVYSGADLVKQNRVNGEIHRFSDKLLGDITALDVTMAMRPILFYQSQSVALILDNTISEQPASRINLADIGLDQVSLVCASYLNNNIWMFDQASLQLLRLGPQLNRIIGTGNLSEILGLDDLQPIHMSENQNKVFLLDPANGIIVFDIFGSHVMTIAKAKNAANFSCVGENLYYYKEGQLFVYNFKTFASRLVSEYPESCSQVKVTKSTIWKLESGRLNRQVIEK